MNALLVYNVVAAIDIEKTLIPILVALLSSGFLFALFKVIPERKSILVQASENAVRVVNDAIRTLQLELTEARAEILKLETELKVTKENRQQLENDLKALTTKIAKLEAEIEIYAKIAGSSLEIEEKRKIEAAVLKERHGE